MNAGIALYTFRLIVQYLSLRIHRQSSCRALLYTLSALPAQGPGLRIVAVFAVDIAPLQEYRSPVARSIHAAERNDAVHRRFHVRHGSLSYLSLQNMSALGSPKAQTSRILQHSHTAVQLLHLGSLHKITGHTDHITVTGIERQIP